MDYIVLDLEWNQPFASKFMVKKPVKLYGEIIQIGAVKIDENFNVIDTFKIVVSPIYYRAMHRNVTKLTQITEDDLTYGFPFVQAFKHFKNWCGSNFEFITWGMDDIEILRDNMLVHKMRAEWIPKVFDAQLIFDNQISKENRQVSLLDALDRVGESALEAHDALHDARNTVRVCHHLDMVKAMSEYDELSENTAWHKKVEGICTTYYENARLAFKDPELLTFKCPTCGQVVECSEVVYRYSDKYIAIAKCNDDEFFVDFKIYRWPNKRISIIRNIRLLTETDRNCYYERVERKRAHEARFIAKLSS